MICRRCDRGHDGSMMRTDKRYTRVSTMLHEEVPKTPGGRFEFCHLCQRSAHLAGGAIKLLINDIEVQAKYVAHGRLQVGACPRCGSDRVNALGGKAGQNGLHKCYACRKQFTRRTATGRHHTKLPDAVWVRAEGLLSAGASTLAVAADLGVTQRSAWLLQKRIALQALGAAAASPAPVPTQTRDEPK